MSPLATLIRRTHRRGRSPAAYSPSAHHGVIMPVESSVSFISDLLLTPEEVAATSQSAPAPARPKRPSRRPPSRVQSPSAQLLEIPLVAAVVAIAFFLRFFRLDQIPPGLRGDEATTGLVSARILREGAIGP